MKTIIAILALSATSWAQDQITSSFSTAQRTNAFVWETEETLDTAATRACSSSTVTVTRTSGTVLTVANGSSSAAIQYVRFNPKTRYITASSTLTINSGTATGAVLLYATLNAAGNVALVWVDSSGNTFTATSGTIVSATAFQPGPSYVLLYSWTITAGSYDATGGTDQQTPTDCWVDSIDLANTTAGAVTVTVTDSQGTAINTLTAVSIAANTTYVIVFPGGRFFEGGMKINASAANSIDARVRGARLYRSPTNP